MSTWVSAEHACPHCGASQAVRVAASINVSRAPASRDALLAGTLHRHTCTRCAVPFVSDDAFEYLDFHRKELYVVYSTIDEPRWAELEGEPQALFARNFSDEALPKAVHDLGAGFKVRAVFGILALQEKVRVFDAGLDDVAVEAFKLDWMRADPLARLHPACRPRATSRAGDELVFVAHDRAGAPVPLAATIATLEAYQPEPRIAEQLFAGPYVDTGRLLFAADG